MGAAGSSQNDGGSAAVIAGVDAWADEGYAPLAGRRVGLITNVTGRSAGGRTTIEVLVAAPELRLVALFQPEHSLTADLEGDIASGIHGPSGLPLHSLYGETRRPTAAMLAGLDGLVFDIQDIGTRFYTYATTMAYAMEEAARHGLPFVVLDRPNPIGGHLVGGPVLDAERRSFVGYAPIPVRHGMTIGELARYFNDVLEIGAELTVVRLRGWQRSMWFDETGLEWIDPSPNIRNLTQALLYPAVGPLETTNISVGRGTDAPFEWIGAPWIDSRRLAAELNGAGLPGVRFVPRRLTPDSSTHAGADCGGVNLIVTARESFNAGLTAATLAVVLRRSYPDAWDRSRFVRLWGDAAIDEQLAAGWSAARIFSSWESRLAAFRDRRARHLIYD